MGRRRLLRQSDERGCCGCLLILGLGLAVVGAGAVVLAYPLETAAGLFIVFLGFAI